jgi:hypothetical protein
MLALVAPGDAARVAAALQACGARRVLTTTVQPPRSLTE